jgi:hypothetical protein
MSTLAIQQFIDWIRAGGTGCLFAQYLAHRFSDARWLPVLLYPEQCGDSLGNLMSELIQTHSGDYEAVFFLFPTVNSPDNLINLLQIILLDNRWSSYEVICDTEVDVVPIAIRWHNPDEQYINWAVGFADFQSMPSTRRAPCTAIVLRTGLPNETAGIIKNDPDEIIHRKADLGRTPVHLADVPTLLATKKQLLAYWSGSQKRRLDKLRDSMFLHTAKAKVTFLLPRNMYAEISKKLGWINNA